MADNPRIEELRRRVQADPASIAFAALAEEYRRAGRFDEAIETCRTGLQRHPSYLSARVTLGRSLLEVQNYDEAQKELEHVLKAAPENLAAIRALAEIHERRGHTPEALEQYKAALEVVRQDAPAPPPQPPSPPAPVVSPIEVALPKATAAPAVRLERITASAVQERVQEPVQEPPRQEQPRPDPPRPDPNAKVLEDLHKFLASIQAARRSISPERPRRVR
jgi:tetratricopeptide (TPR) repeat protein